MNNGLSSPLASPGGGAPNDTGRDSLRFSFIDIGELVSGGLPVELPREIRRS